MLSRTLGFTLVAVGCIAAAGFGAYMAVRHNAPQVVAPAAATPEASTPAGARVAPQGGGVAETEAIVTDERAPAPPTVSARPATPANRPAARVVPRAPAPAPAAAPTRGDWKGLDRPWPTRSGEPVTDATVPSLGAPLPPEPLEPPPPQYEELVVEAGSVIGLQVDTPITTETARLEDRVEARVIRDVMVEGKVAVPAGTRAIGSVTLVERGGKIKERARLGVRFHTLVMADASHLPIQTESIFREGEPPSQESVAKIGGGAAAGAILGAILGGVKGAVIGGATGAGGGTAAVMAGDRNPATLNAGSTVTVRLTAPATVTVER